MAKGVAGKALVVVFAFLVLALFVIPVSSVGVCSDSIDNDNDGLTDYPDDPGCADAVDNSERGIGLICDNGQSDEDYDGIADYPQDLGCSGVYDSSEVNINDQCDDGLDNDQDTLFDFQDPGCNNQYGNDELDPNVICDDGIDNDYDSFTDYPDDPGCQSPTGTKENPQCNDNTDNDGDTFTDFPADLGCIGAYEDNELGTVECNDGINNDYDIYTDYPWDAGCSGQLDTTETNPAIQCDDGVNNDYDWLIDYPADPGCASVIDTAETNAAVQCDDGIDNDGDDYTDMDVEGIYDVECTGPLDNDESVYEPGLAEQGYSCSTNADCACGMVCRSGVCREVDAKEPPELDEAGPCLISGDITGDGWVDCADYACIPNPALPNCINLQCMDVAPVGNPDGVVNIQDTAVVGELTMQNGYNCLVNPPTQGPRACVERACYDKQDNDLDLLKDYPQDSGCWNIFDEGEVAACNDGIDNDQDGITDYNELACTYYDAHGQCRRYDYKKSDLGCSSTSDHTEYGDNQCDDKVDNDLDGFIDMFDRHCSSNGDTSETPDCSDSFDNDGDGFIDLADPHCKGFSDVSEVPDCNDGLDNDQDARTDNQDSGCENAGDFSERTQCKDGIDNDGDGFIDYPADNGCIDEETLKETPACSDDIDNDNDGLTDYPSDGGCSGALDINERGTHICDNGIDDDNDGLTDFTSKPAIRTPSRSNEWIYVSDPGCSAPTASKENPQCDDGVDNDGDGKKDTADPGCINAYEDNELGTAACDDGIDNDGDSKTDHPADSGCESKTDSDEVNYLCNDGIDNDGDTYKDYPHDSGCSYIDDNNERAGPDFSCDNGMDDDGDGLIDYPNDPGCEDPKDRLGRLGNGELSDYLACDDNYDNDYDGKKDYRPGQPTHDTGCSSLTDADEHTLQYQCDDGLDNDRDDRVDFRNGGGGDPACVSITDNVEKGAGSSKQCDDGIDNDFDGKIDYGEDLGCSSYTDDYEGTGTDCDNWVDDNGDKIMDRLIDDDGDGKADYRPGDPVNDVGCMSVFDFSERVLSACDDSLDNDFDGFKDYPADSGCTSILDNSEQADQGPPACDDDLDNDGDGLKDYGIFSTNDPGCDSASDTSELKGTACDDGIDNDNDLAIDYPADPGCYSVADASESSTTAECDNGFDDDNDGFIDQFDLGCYTLFDNSERHEPGVGYECDDGIDNDNDGASDYPADLQCPNPNTNSEGSWQGPTCDNGVFDADNGETDVDCGGSECPVCDNGDICVGDSDCFSNFCNGGICANSCTEQIVQGGNLQAPSFGPNLERNSVCPQCDEDTDCSAGQYCAKDGTCKGPTCNDKIKNGQETDVDCGGPSCGACQYGKQCAANSDCPTGVACVDMGTPGKFCGGCTELFADQNKPNANRANLVFYGIEYTESSKPLNTLMGDIVAGLDPEGKFWPHHKGLLELEIYKDNWKNKMNFWWAPKIGNVPDVNLAALCKEGNNPDCLSCQTKCQNNFDQTYCTGLSNRQVINMCYWRCVGSTGPNFFQEGATNVESYIGSQLFKIPPSDSELAHEFQHLFVKLRDERGPPAENQPPSPQQPAGKNCAITVDDPGDPFSIQNLWGDLLGDDTVEGLTVGAYLGCGATIQYYKPTLTSLMKWGTEQRLGKVNRRLIAQKLDQFSGQ